MVGGEDFPGRGASLRRKVRWIKGVKTRQMERDSRLSQFVFQTLFQGPFLACQPPKGVDPPCPNPSRHLEKNLTGRPGKNMKTISQLSERAVQLPKTPLSPPLACPIGEEGEIRVMNIQRKNTSLFCGKREGAIVGEPQIVTKPDDRSHGKDVRTRWNRW